MKLLVVDAAQVEAFLIKYSTTHIDFPPRGLKGWNQVQTPPAMSGPGPISLREQMFLSQVGTAVQGVADASLEPLS